MWVTTARIQRDFGLPEALAREIIVEGTQHALRRRWQLWAWLTNSLMVPVLATGAGWIPSWHASQGRPGLITLSVACACWELPGRRLGGGAMLAAAADQARRLGRRCRP